MWWIVILTASATAIGGCIGLAVAHERPLRGKKPRLGETVPAPVCAWLKGCPVVRLENAAALKKLSHGHTFHDGQSLPLHMGKRDGALFFLPAEELPHKRAVPFSLPLPEIGYFEDRGKIAVHLIRGKGRELLFAQEDLPTFRDIIPEKEFGSKNRQ